MGSPGRWIFDAAVLVAVASAAWLAVSANWEGAFRFAVVAGLMLAARKADVPTPFAAAFSVFLLLAIWAAVQRWYAQNSEFDALVHVLTPGSTAAVAYFVLVRAGLLPAPGNPVPHLRAWAPVLWVTAVGVTAAVVWEFYEWLIEQVNPTGMRVGYTDTVLDLFAGMLGSLAAGGFVVRWARQHRPSLRSDRSRQAA